MGYGLGQTLRIMMKTHLLRYFVVLAEELHFGRAAQRLCITQPPLSMALKTLEQDLGAVLMERDAKNVRLTPAGEAFLHEARKVLAQLQHAAEVVRGVAQGLQGRLDIGITGSMVYRQVPGFCRAFRAERPLVELCLHEMSTRDQLQAIARGQIDCGFLNIGTPQDDIRTLSIGEEAFVCCLPSEHALAWRAEIDLRELAQDTFVMFAREVAPANYDNVIACLQQAGIHPHTRHAARQWLTVMALVSAGQGVALVPACMQTVGMNGVRFAALRGSRVSTPAVLAWRSQGMPAVLEAFVASVQNLVQAAQPELPAALR
ncbi:LysR family transcriptional regulator [Comamonas testosteroni]|uniref:LysR family transcriptional regulator n=3 Tax=Comamonas testosteroni TaxID=285 RepID=A0A0L7N8S8_COMTE|nr:LysR family transcriptional regulator [Comamonas testosteroni]